MMTPRVFAATAVLVALSAAACNRTQASRDAERASEQVKAAAEQAGEKLADSWLTAKIQAQFFVDEDIKSRFINVRSRDGVVRLKGFVESDDARRQVLEITRNTDGVKQVDDRELLVGRPASESFETATPGLPVSCFSTSSQVEAEGLQTVTSSDPSRISVRAAPEDLLTPSTKIGRPSTRTRCSLKAAIRSVSHPSFSGL